MTANRYVFAGCEKIPTPAMIFYRDLIEENICKAVKMVGDAARLWPHVKTHKTCEIIRMQIAHGITKFKCSTIAEAEMVASCGASEIIFAYPLVGPNISRFLALREAFPAVKFWAIGDNLEQVERLGDAAGDSNVSFLVDVDVGMHRTGVPLDRLVDFYKAAAQLKGISVDGLHCYDGHVHSPEYSVREAAVAQIMEQVFDVQKSLRTDGFSCERLVMGGTPSFPCYNKYDGVYLSPGTVVVSDYGYATNFPEMDFIPAGIILTRVVSHPSPRTFTLDLGTKGIATEMKAVRGVIAGMETCAHPLFQSEEHWVFELNENCEQALPQIGEELYVIPTHVCPSVALYPSVKVVSGGEIIDQWEVFARNRVLNI